MLNELARVEIFSRDYTLRDRGMIGFPKMEYDYLSIDDISITIAKILQAKEQDFILITGKTEKMQGIISEVNYKNQTTVLEIRPLLDILDIEIWHDMSTSKSKSPEQIIADMITDTYIHSGDEAQNIKGLVVKLQSKTEDAVLDRIENKVNIYDICIEVLKLYSIAVEFEINIMKKQVICRVGKATSEIKTVECDLYNVIDSEVVFKQKKKAYNKIIIIGEYKEDSEQYGQIERRIYYLDKEGNVTQEPTERLLPVLWKIETMDVDAEFEEKAYAKAVSQLTNEQYNNYIRIQVRNDDPIVKKEKFSIGQQGRIVKNGIEYISIYTGYKIDKTTTLYFGLIRTEYTKSVRKGGMM